MPESWTYEGKPVLGPIAWTRLQLWKYRNRHFWWQFSPDWFEAETFLVEGKKGEGKTRYLAGYACKQMRQGVRVCSNFTVTDLLTGNTSVKIGGWLDVLEYAVDALEYGIPTIFAIDEFQAWLDSRAWKDTPDWFRVWLAQSRHYGVGLCGTVQNFSTVEIRARQLVDTLVRVRRLSKSQWAKRIPVFWKEEVDPESVDSTTGYLLEERLPAVNRWYAGYSTRELVTIEKFVSDEEIDARVKELTDRAALLVRPEEFESFKDYEESRKRAMAA